MALNNVTSTLPDPDYIRELEKIIAELRADNERIKQDLRVLNGR